jgi:hypothetical protein
LTRTAGWLFNAVWSVRVGEASSEYSVIYNIQDSLFSCHSILTRVE